jgi:hypothetical protein
MKPRAATLVILLAVCTAACATRQKKTETLLETSQRYQEGIRWQRFEDAASHVPPALREAFLDEHDELSEDLRIDDYEVIRVKFKKNNEEARVQVKYTWHRDSEGLVKETVTDQRWKLHGLTWLLEEEVVRRGEDMPGVKKKPRKPADADDDTPGPDDDEGDAPDSRGNASGGAPL